MTVSDTSPEPSTRSVVGTLQRNPSALLLAVQLLSVLAYPFLD